MSNGNKRHLIAVNDDVSHQPPRKKQRIEIKIRTMFKNQEDHRKCIQIYQAFVQSTLVIKEEVPSSISLMIAEYSAGILSQCFYCGEVESYLNADNITSNKPELVVCRACTEKVVECKFCCVQ